MTRRQGPILETTIVVDNEAAVGLEAWLGDYLSAFRTDAGIVDVQLFTAATGERTSHVAQFSFESDEAIDEFMVARLAGLEHDIDEAAAGTAVSHSSRVLREDRSQNIPGKDICLNCETPLRGQYCAQCGQRSQSRLISLWELITDAFGDLFELDSRLWKTLGPLLIRPGRLTADYLQGKRARFMPPFRTYLVLSLLFFVVAFFDPREDLAILYAEDPVPEQIADSDSSTEADTGGTEFDFTLGDEDAEDEDDEPDFDVLVGGQPVEDGNCQIDDEDMMDMPGWLQRRLTKQRLTHICQQATMDDGEQLLENVLDNIPAALIVLLPLMAFALKALYPLSRRYYVEHLLFFVHFHAFFFLLLTLQILWIRTIAMVNLNDAIGILPVVVSSFYIPVYLFKSMRRVYGQGFLLTLLKYLVLLAVYAAGFTATMLGAFAIAAFSI
ncbi:MAG: DUF3667 domain-containing protein [Woeseiaceae bacterium]|nr:DUF3667 domain-containing protein [Woeseiaceae bacterium]